MGAIRIFWASARPLRPKISEMPDVAAGKARAQFRCCWWRFHQKQCLGERQPNCCRVFSGLFPGYYGLSLSVGLSLGDAQARS